jgi:hypothetical protein
VPGGERAIAERVAHFRQVAVLVVTVFPATAKEIKLFNIKFLFIKK